MSGIQQLLLGGSPAGYQIERSLRFNSADSAYLNRTPASAGNRKTWTWSSWVKRGSFGGAAKTIISAGASGTNPSTGIQITGNEIIQIYDYTSSYNFQLDTTPVYRDPSSWYHIVVAFDTTQATASNRIKLYVNGSQVTAFSTATYPTQNTDYQINSTNTHYISRFSQSAASYLDGYLTEINFIDGQALTPSSFGQTNASTGVWEPVKYTGTYGTNGFYLNFSDNSNTTAATLGKDSSGNGNNYTPNNFSVTAGTGNDSLVDTPTSYGTDTGVGGEVRGNYCTLNPFQLAVSGALFTLANGNLDYSCSASTGNGGRMYSKGTMALSTGKIYWEVQVTNTNPYIGVISEGTVANNGTANGDLGGAGVYNTSQTTIGTTTATYSGTTFTFTTNDIIGFAWDGTALTLGCYKNGSLIGTWSNFESTKTWFPSIGATSSSSATTAIFNFGQRPFAYTAPSGYKALCTQNLPTPTIGATSTTQANDYFDVSLYTGTGSSLNITGLQFQPDFVWIKGRSGATDHGLYDAVRGVQKQLESNTTTAETTETTGLTAFNSDGFTVGALAQLNTSTATYVGWNWNAGGSNATNTSGTITSTVRANTTAGFSIVTYTGTGANATVGHGLGVAPSMIIYKRRSASDSWIVYHASIGAANNLVLNSTAAQQANGNVYWNSTAPTSSVFGAGTDSAVNANASTYVAYCFAAVAGYSAFGSITGNGSTDGPFCYLGFRPAFVMLKRTDSTSNWTILDFQREGYNVDNDPLYPNLSDAEGTADLADLLSNGFKLRSTDTSVNANGGTYVYAAFAQNPFKYSLAR